MTLVATAGSPLRMAATRALIAVGAMRGRQGREDADGCLERAEALARDHPEVDAVSPVVPALVEHALLLSEAGRAREMARAGLERACGAWERGALWFWGHQAGADPAPPASLPEPYALLHGGDWRASAAWWEVRGCPYDHAMGCRRAVPGGAPPSSCRRLTCSIRSVRARAH